ncbi:MAG: hypothetical protein ACK4S6_17095 [Roseateles asaccharophilus]|jgi:hypothetical protein|uniref:Uncharacterized protein n=1 Tax=Roseateles asaccharophilus TaxID=582607 RepID=A0A4R6MSK1_9BURK|nr:hypothetical protein [Roseateles asaccharophilus]MDN3546558.1 hypothetical protein [Roseateles asaccharophilus]TDP05020.1 hypothetical protein DFR39_11252 [Roseateles asaccharophilus]
MHALPPTDINDAPNVALGQTLEQPLLAVESCLNLLGEALLRRDTQAIELHASALHQALAEAIAMFSEAARAGQVPPNLRHRLVQAGGRVAAQRESLARATAALDRAIDVLMPGEATGLYSAMGKSERKTLGGGSYQA